MSFHLEKLGKKWIMQALHYLQGLEDDDVPFYP